MEAQLAAADLEPRSPGVRDMAPPVLIAPLAAAVVFGIGTLSWNGAQIAAISAAGTVFLVGWPVIFWMLDNGRRGPVARTVAGIICGAAPLVAALVSGIVGLYIKSNDLSYVRWALGYGASMPYYGLIIWSKFAWLVALGMLTGVVAMWASTLLSAHRPD